MHESPPKGTGWGQRASPPPLPVAGCRGDPLLATLLSLQVEGSPLTQPCMSPATHTSGTLPSLLPPVANLSFLGLREQVGLC